MTETKATRPAPPAPDGPTVTVLLEIPPDIYKRILPAAKWRGTTPEGWFTEWLQANLDCDEADLRELDAQAEAEEGGRQ